MKLRFTILFAVLTLTGFSQWVKLPVPTNSPLNCLSFLDSTNGMVGGTGGTLLITEDGGESWWTPMNSPQEDFHTVYMLNTQVMFVGGNNLYRTGNGGASWTMVSDMTSPRSISFSSPLIGKCTSVSGIFETTDGGITWTGVNTGNTSIFETVESFDETAIAMGNVGGYVTYSAIGKRTSEGQWYDFDLWSFPNSYAWTSSSFPTPDTGYVFFNQFNHWFPSDHNQFIRLSNFALDLNIASDLVWMFTSEVINDNVPDLMTSLYFTDNNHGFATGELGSLYYTANGGVDWFVDYAGTATLTAMQFITNNLAFAVGYDGTILKHDVSTKVASPELNNTFEIYPNPATNLFIIKDTKNVVSIEVISASGNVVRSINGTSDDHMQIPVDNITPGVYMIKMTGIDNSVKVAKLMVK